MTNVLLIFSFLFFGCNALNLSFNATLNSKNTTFIPIHPFRANFQAGQGFITIEHSAALSVCLQRLVPAPPPLAFSSCSFTFNITNSTTKMNTTQPFNALDENYYISISLVNKSNSDNITVLINGQECNNTDPVWNGQSCQAAKILDIQGLNSSIPSGESQYYQFNVDPNTSNFTISTNESFLLFVKYAGSPSANNYDGKGVKNLTVLVPQAGNWTLWVQGTRSEKRQSSIDYSLSYNYNTCSFNTSGPSCEYHIQTPNMTVFQTNLLNINNSWIFYEVFLQSGKSFNVTVKSSNSTRPNIYASPYQIPTENSAVIKGCNQAVCYYADIISVSQPNNTENVTWYVGINHNSTNGSLAFSIWFNSICAPNCEMYGVCSNSNDTFGQCDCNDDLYLGIDCQTPNTSGYHSEYLVLIVFGSMVFASFIIGGIVWLLTRDRRVGYEKINN